MQHPLTVLYVHASAELYGSDVALLNLVRHLPPQVRPIAALPEEGPLADRLREHGATVAVFPLAVPRRYYFHPRRFHRVLGLPFEAMICRRRMRSLIRRERVDLVHINVSILPVPAQAARRCGVPVVWHWREVLARQGRMSVFLIKTAELLAARILCISDSVREQFRGNPRAVTVYDAIVPEDEQRGDLERLRKELGLAPGAPCVGIVGRINDMKGQDVLIRAAPAVLRRFPETRFLIVGDVYKKNIAIRRQYEHLADELNVRHRIIFTGFRADAQALIELFDVFVMASKLPEGFGIVMLEAMLKCKPVIATHCGAQREVVVAGQTGLFVPPNDPPALAEAICELLGDPARRAAMGQKGRQRVLDHFTIERQVDQVLHIYDEVLREKNQTPRANT
ncbi:MAG: glycosyltransferase family 4 protein [Candidatus Sumerlaeia bacterium]|nr:glycosyltransferase family 4 protein [Candidatus Sumerlaeia bacterium]